MTLHLIADPAVDPLKAYLALGMSIVPCWGIKNGHCACPAGAKCDRSPGKHPNPKIAPNGVHSATRDPVIIAEWQRRYPQGNWAVKSGEPLAGGGFLVVVDEDPRNGGDVSIQQCGPLPATVMADTGGGGHHYLYRSETPCASRVAAPGVEILAIGKYFMVAPSKHELGPEYTWALGMGPEDVAIAPAPDWVLEGGDEAKLRPARLGDGTARDTVLGEAFHLAGLLGMPQTDGSIAVTCPWADVHSDARGRGEDTSTVILPPAGGSRFGGFRCMHSHCASRKWQDVMQSFAPHVGAEARRKFPLRPVELVLEETNTPAIDVRSDYDKDMDLCRRKITFKNVKGGYKIQCDIINAITVLSFDPRWKGILRYDQFAQNIRFMREPEWHEDDKPAFPFEVWTDSSANCLDAWLRRHWALELPAATVMQGAAMVAERDAYNPLRDWLATLKWDGVERLASWGVDYLGAADNAYTKAVCTKWLISAVARAYKPGCKADHVLILEGPQGRGKSTALEALAGRDWFTDTPIDIGNKDAYLALRGKWIVELAELATLKKSDADRAKAFFSSPVDTYRPPYGRTVQAFPRSCVFAGSVNAGEYLTDDTGNRRYWPVKCGIIDVEGLREARAQIWAEAIVRFGEGATWWPTYEESKLFEAEQLERVIPDLWESVVSDWLRSKAGRKEVADKGGVSLNTVLEQAIRLSASDYGKGEMLRMTATMDRLGWVRFRQRSSRFNGYLYKPKSMDAALST